VETTDLGKKRRMSSTLLSQRPVEATAAFDALDALGPSAFFTSCPGGSAHHVAAHLAGNYEEMRRHVEAARRARR
jgi:hypothetical protein